MAVEAGQPRPDDAGKKALVRLVVAGLVISMALIGLWWLDRDGKAPTRISTSTAPQPVPILPAPAPDLPPPVADTDLPREGDTPAADAGQDTPMPEVAAERPAPPEPPPPPRVHNTPGPVARAAQPMVGMRQTPAPPTIPAAAQPAASAAHPPTTGGFLLQIGVFGNPARAVELVQRLQRQGIRARTETRVQVGPFPTREEAEKARIEMRRLGLDGMITTPATTQ
ncbi:MAG TPA: SPOR domain-containing protein [Thiobacillaceae bacterium]|nr:SPOR domain-containing protein [Thiobacillaceae bacterium]HNU63354.1 SPOR domain-containing protein [Thiobacillaceae bacterium]